MDAMVYTVTTVTSGTTPRPGRWGTLADSVRVPVVNVRVVWVPVHQRTVFVGMGVRLARWVARTMGMPVMLIVRVPMGVR